MLRNTLRRNKGITLIALVVTIIVLLILAGISTSMLTGQNGILNRAAEAKEKTETASKDEQRKLAQTEALMNTKKTTYKGITLPEGFAPTKIEGEDSIDDGLVITDGYGNEYVWVEVPTTIYSDSKYNAKGIPNSADDWEKIRDCLKAYTADYSDSSYKDTNTDGTTYSDDYKNMLKSVYTNGGFWIGRYEAGLEEGKNPRTSYVAISASDKAVVKQNKIPYNYVTRDEAQTLAERMNYNGCTSSLIFGIQWDLTLKYIEEKTVEAVEEANKDTVRTDIKSKLTSDSRTIGNYYNSAFILNRGKFAKNGALSKWFAYNDNSESTKDLVAESQKKSQSSYENGILLTTGATDATKLQNIYDIAGNVWEWTLEFYDTSAPCVSRGGNYVNLGSDNPAKDRYSDNTSYSLNIVGFRVGLWK